MDSLEREARERKKKLVALGSLPLCVGFFVWRLQSTTTAAPPPKAPPPPVTAQAAPAVAAAAGPVLTLEKSRVVVVPMGNRDPFIPAAGIMVAAAPPPQMQKPVSVTETPVEKLIGHSLPAVDTTMKFFGPVKPVDAQLPVNEGQGKTVAPPAPEPAAAPAEPVMPYMLTGVVKGNPDVAILRHIGDGSRRIARVGDALDKIYRLITIDVNSVVIEGAGQTRTIRLGGDLPPVAAPAAKK